MPGPNRSAILAASMMAAAVAAPAAAASFAPISERDRGLTEVPGEPEAPAVEIFRNGRFTMMGALTSKSYSSLVVEGRIKLLAEAGSEHGEVAVPHSDFIRLVSFDGRTVSPDGTEVPLPETHSSGRP